MEPKEGRPTTIDAYISQFPEDVQAILARIRAVIQESAPGAEERISYQMPAFYLNGYLVYFAAYKRHIGFYPTGAGIELSRMSSPPTSGQKGRCNFRWTSPSLTN